MSYWLLSRFFANLIGSNGRVLGQHQRSSLEDGTVFKGVSIGQMLPQTGEVVFNHFDDGYQEILTILPYARQCRQPLTYPILGILGVNL